MLKKISLGGGDIAAQSRQCFENIRMVLAEVGGELRDIVSITTYFTDRNQLPEIQKVRSEYLDFDHPPVSTSVMVAGLGHEDFLVEHTGCGYPGKSFQTGLLGCAWMYATKMRWPCRFC